MRRILCAAVLAATALPGLAAPDGPEEAPRFYSTEKSSEKSLDKSLERAPEKLPEKAPERSLLGRLEQVSHSVAERAGSVRDRAADLVVNAMGSLGVPYRRGGQSADTGFDCSGFVRSMYEQTLGLVLPRRAKEQAAATQVIDKNELKPGDLVFFNTMRRAFSHVGIYVGDGKFIHSPKPGAQVRVESMGASYWAKRFDGARRVDATSTPLVQP